MSERQKISIFHFFTFMLILVLTVNFSLALEIQNLPSSLSINHGTQKQFSFSLVENNGVNVSITNANCQLSIGSCSINCPSQILANTNVACSGNANVNLYTPPGNYDLDIGISYNESGTIKSISGRITVNVPSSPNLNLAISIDDMKSNEKQVKNLVVSNTGNVDLNVNLEAWVEDSDGNNVDYFNISLSETSFSLAPGDTKNVNVSLEAKDVYSGSYTLKIKANYGYGEKIISKSFKVYYGYCSSDSTNDYLSIEIKNKDDFEGDNFEPYNILEIKVKVKNKDNDQHDVIVEAVLVKDDEIIDDSEVSEDITIDKDSYETITLSMEIPNVDEGRYYVYVKAYDDDNEKECVQDSSYIDIEKPTRKVKLKSIYLDKTSYACGDQILVSGSVVNIGSYDEDIVKLVYSDDIGNTIETSFSLDEGDEKNFIFQPSIPLNASEGNHVYSIKIYYDYSKSKQIFNRVESYSNNFNVNGNCIKPKRDVSFSLNLPSTLEINKTYEGTLFITNSGDLITTYTIKVSANWANIKLEKSLITLNPGDSYEINLEITPIKYGNNINVEVEYYGEKKTATEIVNVREPLALGEEKYRKASWFDEIRFEFERRPWAFWTVVVSVAVAFISLVGIIIVLLTKK